MQLLDLRDAALLVLDDRPAEALAPALAEVVAAWRATGRLILAGSAGDDAIAAELDGAGVRTVVLVGGTLASDVLARAVRSAAQRGYRALVVSGASPGRGRPSSVVDPAAVLAALARGTAGVAADGFPRFRLDPV